MSSTVKAIWEYESRRGHLPGIIDHAIELESIANALISTADLNTRVLTTIPQDLIQ
jgi:hypothetical protein